MSDERCYGGARGGGKMSELDKQNLRIYYEGLTVDEKRYLEDAEYRAEVRKELRRGIVTNSPTYVPPDGPDIAWREILALWVTTGLFLFGLGCGYLIWG